MKGGELGALSFYLSESLTSSAASRGLVGFSNLVKHSVGVILNTPLEFNSVKKLRVSAIISLAVRAVYPASADPTRFRS